MARTLATLLLLFSAPEQASAPASRPATDWHALVQRCFGGGDAAREGMAALARAVERDYAGAFAAWKAMPEGGARECLESVLSLPGARTATLVLRGRIQRIETVQGGVIDYHNLCLTFAGLEVLRNRARQGEALHGGTLIVVRGTNADAWLTAQLRQGLERVTEERVWLFRHTELRRPTRAGEPERTLTILEWTTLPAAAAPCLREVLR